jgi:simple sugar transport system permease protein
MAFMCATLKVDQVVTGLAINLLASGVTSYLFRLAFMDVAATNLPNVATFRVLRIPVLSQVPVIGEVLFSQQALTYMAVASVPLIWLFLGRTRHGLELRMMGENPRAVDMHGISVVLRQYLAVIFGSMMAGAAGAFLTLASAGLFVPQMTAGRGFIAFALVIVGNWSAWRVLLGALFFGLIDSLQLQLQAVGVDLPHQLLLALPYVLTIVILVVSRGRSRSPLALGVPYVRS